MWWFRYILIPRRRVPLQAWLKPRLQEGGIQGRIMDWSCFKVWDTVACTCMERPYTLGPRSNIATDSLQCRESTPEASRLNPRCFWWRSGCCQSLHSRTTASPNSTPKIRCGDVHPHPSPEHKCPHRRKIRHDTTSCVMEPNAMHLNPCQWATSQLRLHNMHKSEMDCQLWEKNCYLCVSCQGCGKWDTRALHSRGKNREAQMEELQTWACKTQEVQAYVLLSANWNRLRASTCRALRTINLWTGRNTHAKGVPTKRYGLHSSSRLRHSSWESR